VTFNIAALGFSRTLQVLSDLRFARINWPVAATGRLSLQLGFRILLALHRRIVTSSFHADFFPGSDRPSDVGRFAAARALAGNRPPVFLAQHAEISRHTGKLCVSKSTTSTIGQMRHNPTRVKG
jgi:hypothetical protein